MPEGDEILRFARARDRWSFKAMPPFHIEPPIRDAQQLARLFTGRRAELSRVILPLYNGRNILVRGMLGVGKSAFILRLLHELDAQARAAKGKLLPIYIYHFYGGTTDDFYRLILFAVAQVLADKDDDEAKGVLEALRGIKVTASRSRGMGAKFGVHLFQVAKAEVDLEAKEGATREVTLANPFDFLARLVERANRRFGRLVIAVDDLDKAKPENLRLVQAMLQGALPLLRSDRLSFILTGITLPLARTPVRNQQREDPHPFTEEAIAEAAARSHGIPRLFNIICARTLEQAALQGIEVIDAAAFARCYEAIQTSRSAEVTPQMRAVLAVAKRYDGFSSEMPDEALDKLGLTTFIELIPLADYLVANDLMVRQEYEGGVRYTVADIAAKAAQS